MFLKGLHLIHQYRFSRLISILAEVKTNWAAGEVEEIDQPAESWRTSHHRALSGALLGAPRHICLVFLSQADCQELKQHHHPQRKMWLVNSTWESAALLPGLVTTHTRSGSHISSRPSSSFSVPPSPGLTVPHSARILQKSPLCGTISPV